MQINMCAVSAGVWAANRIARSTHAAKLAAARLKLCYTHALPDSANRGDSRAHLTICKLHKPLEFCVDCSDRAISLQVHGKMHLFALTCY